MKAVNEICPSGITVFACKFWVWRFSDRIHSSSYSGLLPLMDDYNMGKMTLCFDVYGTQFNRIRTVCYGEFEHKDHKHKTPVCGIAYLNKDHPEEFDVEIGIFQSFARAIHNLVGNATIKPNDQRAIRKDFWCCFGDTFNEYFMVTEDEPFGIWRVAWDEDFVQSNIGLFDILSDELVDEILDKKGK